MQGKATFFKHPIHPILVVFPIAFFVGSVVADVLLFYTARDYWTRVAITLIGFGLVGGIAAAVFGYIDYTTAPLSPRAQQVGRTHMLLNIGVIVIFLINYFVRRNTPESALGYLLSLVGIVLLGVSGWLGGVLIFEERVGVAEETRTGPYGR